MTRCSSSSGRLAAAKLSPPCRSASAAEGSDWLRLPGRALASTSGICISGPTGTSARPPELHPGFPDVERVRHDCDLWSKAQPFLHREEVQWALLVLAFAGTLVSGGLKRGGRSRLPAAASGVSCK